MGELTYVILNLVRETLALMALLPLLVALSARRGLETDSSRWSCCWANVGQRGGWTKPTSMNPCFLSFLLVLAILAPHHHKAKGNESTNQPPKPQLVT